MWSRSTPSYAILSILALSTLVVSLIKYGWETDLQEAALASQRRLGIGKFFDPKSTSVRIASGVKTYRDLIDEDALLPQYSLKSAIQAAEPFESRFALLRYDPTNDKFIGYYSKKHTWVTGCAKMGSAIHQLTVILKALFPERFTPDSPELVLAVEGGDYPDVMPYRGCIYKNRGGPCSKSFLTAAPILSFSSVFSDPLFPQMIGMPMPGQHLPCFLRWTQGHGLCPLFKNYKQWENVEWDQLKPQLVWRGTDFGFLSIVGKLDRPTFKTYIEGQIDPNADQNEAATAILKKNFSKLLPRWKGVVLTAESEIEARRTNTLPKVNIKFGLVPDRVKEKYWESIDFPAVGKLMGKNELATYKYQIDIGGGGGTTWTGTMQKLKMPGLLFHHETATKDYIHDNIVPWVHYVPVKQDLSDLMEKLEWAESHPAEAKQIADNATALMAELGTYGGFEQLFNQHMLNPLMKVIEAYTPMDLRDDTSWDDAFAKLGGDNFTPFVECTNGGCSTLGEERHDERTKSH